MYRQTKNYENLQKRIFDGVGQYGIPQIKPVRYKECEWLGFNYARSEKDRAGKGVHFFLDDYQFNSVWQTPDKYLDMFRQFSHVMSPDFSTYTDFPKAIQIYNHYRKHWLGAYWQGNGITVIPTISWSDESSFDWCFDGEPVGGAVAVSSVGTQMNTTARALFLAGYKEMLKRLQPSQILFYGSIPPECGGGRIVPILTFQDGLKRRVSKKFTQNEGNSQEDVL